MLLKVLYAISYTTITVDEKTAGGDFIKYVHGNVKDLPMFIIASDWVATTANMHSYAQLSNDLRLCVCMGVCVCVLERLYLSICMRPTLALSESIFPGCNAEAYRRCNNAGTTTHRTQSMVTIEKPNPAIQHSTGMLQMNECSRMRSYRTGWTN